MQERFVVVVDDYGGSYYRPFDHIGPLEVNPEVIVRHPEKVALVVFTGGEDVSPHIYGEQANRKTYANVNRDVREKAAFEAAVKSGLPIAGICRGSQLICALSGGKLAQDITGHHRSHMVETDQGEKILVSSTHHQMQLPPDNAKIVAWASPMRSAHYEGPPGVFYNPPHEYEVVYYPNTNAVGMQYHPEFMKREERGFRYCGELVERFLGVK